VRRRAHPRAALDLRPLPSPGSAPRSRRSASAIPADPRTQLGPVISARFARSYASSACSSAPQQAGGPAARGRRGAAPVPGDGYYLQATAPVRRRTRPPKIAQHEVFRPGDRDLAVRRRGPTPIRIANRHPVSASPPRCGPSTSPARTRVAKPARVRHGVDQRITTASIPASPWGRLQEQRRSGPRDRHRVVRISFTEPRAVTVNTSGETADLVRRRPIRPRRLN